MRARLAFLILIAIASLLGFGTEAFAEKAKAKEDAKIYSRAGERGKVVIKLKEGQVMRIDRKEGRWLKVRVSGRTGWIPRSKVDLIEEEEMARNTRRRPFVDGRGTKRGFGGQEGPADRVGADAVGDGDGDDGEKPKKPKGKDSDDSDDTDDTDDDPKPAVKAPKTLPKTKTTKPPKKDPEEDGDTDGEEPKIKDDDDEPEATKEPSRPKVRVTAKATIYTEANAESEEAEWSVKPKMVLFPTGKKGKFTEVENDEGEIGFILTAKVESLDSDSGSDDDDGPKRMRQLDVRGRLGVTIIQQGLRSDGPVMQPDNYNLSTSAVTVSLGGAYLRPYGKKYMIGGEATLDVAKAVPGVTAPANAAGESQTTGITLYHLNARAMAGLDLKKKSGMMVFGRLGLRYQSYQISNVKDLDKNTAKLPSEIITSPTIGAALAMPRLTSKIGLRFSLDAMLVGASLKQTKNLEDGDKTSAKGAIIGAGFTYRWKPSMDINAGYDFNYTKYNFGTPIATSMRGHTGTGEVKRTDTFHSLTVGIAKAF